jgi:hypothetical protein
LSVIRDLEELLALIKNTLIHVSALDNEDISPYRNILLRNVLENVFTPIIKSRVNFYELNEFQSNISSVQVFFESRKAKLLRVRNCMMTANFSSMKMRTCSTQT